MSKVKSFIKLSSKFKSDLKAQMREYEDLDSPADQLEKAKIRGYKTAAEARKADQDKAFNYIESAKTPQEALKRSRDMFPDQSYSVGSAIQSAGGVKKAFKISPIKKSKGGFASAAKTITSGTTQSRNKTKPRGVGVATRGFGKALK